MNQLPEEIKNQIKRLFFAEKPEVSDSEIQEAAHNLLQLALNVSP